MIKKLYTHDLQKTIQKNILQAHSKFQKQIQNRIKQSYTQDQN